MQDAPRSTLRVLTFTTLVFCGTLTLAGGLVAAAEQGRREQARRAATELASSYAQRLEHDITRSLDTTYAIAALVRQRGGTPEEFGALAAELLRLEDQRLASLQLAPAGVVREVFPLAGNEAAVGHDVFADPERRAAALLAVEQRRLVLTGPVELRQGGRGLIGRLPIFLPDEHREEHFWGFAIAVIRVEELLAGSGLKQARVGQHPVEVLLQTSTGGDARPLGRGPRLDVALTSVAVEVIDATLRLRLGPAPAKGPGSLPLEIVLAVSFAGFAAALVYVLARRRAVLARQVGERTAALQETNDRLVQEIAERERIDRELRRLSRLHAVLTGTNEVIARVHDRVELLGRVCRIATEHGAADTAWITLFQGDEARGVASAGPFVELCERHPPTEHERAELRAGRTVLCETAEGERCRALQAAGFRSALLLPLRSEGALLGALQLLSRREEGFHLSELTLFSELAADLSFALVTLAQDDRRRIAEEKLRKLSRAVEQSASAVMITDIDGRIEYVNPRFTKITGWTSHEVVGETPRLLRAPQTPAETHRRLWETVKAGFDWQGELHNKRKNGELYWCLQTISPLKDEHGAITHFVAITEDISQRKEAESQIRHLAFYDPLTGLPNRRLFRDRLSQALAHAQRDGAGLAVLTLDLDRFKTVNDSLGHPAGDALLQKVTERISPELEPGDTLARLGGDEFALVRTGIQRPEEAAKLARALLERLAAPMEIEGRELYAGASVGITLYPHDGAELDTLLRNADLALYRAKDEGGGCWRFFTADQNTVTQKRLTLENTLRGGIDRHELVVHYQPQVELSTGRIAGAEALVRWVHPTLGMVSPADFIPLAEETGLIVPLGTWVLREACRAAQAWPSSRGIAPTVAVNVAARQLREPGFAELVARVLAETGLPAGRLELELTESAVLDRPDEALATLQALHTLGVRLSIDDFGTGVSSLARLKALPFHVIKIDRSFVADVVLDPGDRAIVSAIVALGHSLGLEVLAEGVETDGQLQIFEALGGDLVQGWLVGRAVPDEELVRFLERAVDGLPRFVGTH